MNSMSSRMVLYMVVVMSALGMRSLYASDEYAERTLPVQYASQSLGEQNVLDYFKLGKLYLLQGDLAQSYQQFALGEHIDEMVALGTTPPAQVLQNDMMQKASLTTSDSLNDYLRDLLALYVQRVELLSKNPSYADEALKEIEKIFIIDPTNERAHALQRIIRAQKQVHEKKANTKNLREEPVVQKEHAGEVKAEPVIETGMTTKTVMDPEDPAVDQKEKEAALLFAEEKMSTVVRAKHSEADERLIKQHYDEGKRFLDAQDYFSAVLAFRQVLARDPNHMYAAYARKFIAVALQKIEEKENYDMARVKDGVVSKGHDEKLTEPSQGSSFSEQGTSLEMKKKEILRAQITKVLASIEKHIASGNIVRAEDNIRAVRVIDPENNEVRELEKKIFALKEDQRTRAVEKTVRDIVAHEAQAYERLVQERKRYEAIRRELAQKKNAWRESSRVSAAALMKKKLTEKSQEAEDAWGRKDVVKAHRAVSQMLILDPHHVRGKELEQLVEGEIRRITHLLEPQGKQHDDKAQLSVVTPRDETKKEESHKSLVHSVEKTIALQKQLSKSSAAPTVNPSQATRMFKEIAQFKPVSLLTPRSKAGEEKIVAAKTPVPVAKPLPTKDAAFLQDVQKKEIQPVVGDQKQQEEVLQNTREKTDVSQRVFSEAEELVKETLEQRGKTADTKLIEYIERGKRHLREGNYPLALVSFNKVKGLDYNGLFTQEVDAFIADTEAHLGEK